MHNVHNRWAEVQLQGGNGQVCRVGVHCAGGNGRAGGNGQVQGRQNPDLRCNLSSNLSVIVLPLALAFVAMHH